MPFSDNDYKQIINHAGNRQLLRNSEEKYTQFKGCDPFPEIDDTLLNSVSIVKYCMTTGMIEPFDIKGVKGVTYTCHFSGNYFYWDGEENNLQRVTNSNNNDLLLRPNSITYLEIDELLRVPDYLIIRYNLQVNHVYKGLLLGTGPIVDPGFVGHLYIPLHNLTSNEYQVKKGAPLITLEFTKIGRNLHGVHTNVWPQLTNSTFDFTAIGHQPESIKANRSFDTYLQKALIGNDLFKSKNGHLCVGSSIPEKIKSAEESARKAEVSANRSRRALEAARNILLSLGVLGLAAIFFAGIALLNDVNGRIDNVLSTNISISADNNLLQENNVYLSEENERLRTENDRLENENSALRAIIEEIDSSKPTETTSDKTGF